MIIMFTVVKLESREGGEGGAIGKRRRRGRKEDCVSGRHTNRKY